jgi:hypothetical protein
MYIKLASAVGARLIVILGYQLQSSRGVFSDFRTSHGEGMAAPDPATNPVYVRIGVACIPCAESVPVSESWIVRFNLLPVLMEHIIRMHHPRGWNVRFPRANEESYKLDTHREKVSATADEFSLNAYGQDYKSS